MSLRTSSLPLLLLLAVPACDRDGDHVALPGDDRVLAEVGGEQITKWDLDHAIETTLSESAGEALDDTGRRHMLETLVGSRAIANARANELTPTEREELSREVAILREQLLVRRYLEAHSTPAAVSTQMVERYYTEHPERFGGGVVRTYAMLFSTRTLTDAERTTFLARFADLPADADLASLASQASNEGLPVAHQSGEIPSTTLHERLRNALQSLPVGQTAPVTFVDGRAFVMKVTGEQRRAPRPIADVSAEIRQTLAPTQLRDSIQAVRRRVLANTTVRYR